MVAIKQPVSSSPYMFHLRHHNLIWVNAFLISRAFIVQVVSLVVDFSLLVND